MGDFIPQTPSPGTLPPDPILLEKGLGYKIRYIQI